MNDHQIWELGLQQVVSLYDSLSPPIRQQMAALLERYRREKEQLAAIVAQANAKSICRDCLGQCCMNGKFRLNTCDALVLSLEQLPLRPDFLQKPLCPYGGVQGCLLSPPFRPLDCILFICDQIEGRLSEADRSELLSGEVRLREYLQQASRLAGSPLAGPMLLWSVGRPV